MARILHIEDDPRNRLLVRKLLAPVGHEVIDAGDGLEGVRTALQIVPDLVLVDLNIPGLDGYEVTLRLRNEPTLVDVPIIAITAEGDRDTSLVVGCDGFLRKPIDARSFAAQIGSFLGGLRERANSTHEERGEKLRKQGGLIVARLEQKVEELSQANDRLLEMERLRTEFYRNVSHELASPLTPIVGYLRMLRDHELGPLNPSQVRAVRAMSDCVQRLRSTLDSLVDVTAVAAGTMRFQHRPYDMGELLRRSVNEFSSRIGERALTLLREIPSAPMPAIGDVDRVERAVAQLLDNAVKFAPDGGLVGVRLSQRGDRYEVLVGDSGPGIEPEARAQVFDAFYQIDGSTTRAYGGVGVGLAVAQHIARGHGGDVRVLEGAMIEGMQLGGATLALTVKADAREGHSSSSLQTGL